ncbi:recombinase family protein [Streptomyces sp. 4N509B]|uniref:recombinase family protein n=1 Tax=Streptomyces sp. 4N509B TaxID=3457413 RepID=UPI003FD1101D
MDEIERPYDGCGKCLLGVRRLSRVKAGTLSPERQREDVLAAAEAVGGHIIDWADDWEVSGATDPMTRPMLGPWLRDQRATYDGLVAAAVDRLGRNVVDCLNTGYKMRDEGKLLVTYGHEGVWDLDDPADENRFTMEAWGAQMELRAIQRRNRNATVKMRAAGRPKGKSSYGFRYVRTVPNGRVEGVELHPHAAEVLREIARRILADPENVTCSSEAARLNRLGELSPSDHLAVMYGRPARGRPWQAGNRPDRETRPAVRGAVGPDHAQCASGGPERNRQPLSGAKVESCLSAYGSGLLWTVS